ncbi:MAG TPA: hypothetical protein VMC80_00045 [Patescibacteria group bacterium]|nr:hypothetical protein [Patescibacteria group bacterium]
MGEKEDYIMREEAKYGYNPELDLWNSTRTAEMNEAENNYNIMRRMDEYLLEKK